MQKKADAGQDILWSLVDRRAYAKVRSRLIREDTQAGEFLSQIAGKLIELLDLPQNEEYALNRLRNVVTNHWDMGNIRNQVFKAADLLGLNLPSGMFASKRAGQKKGRHAGYDILFKLIDEQKYNAKHDEIEKAGDAQTASLFLDIGATLAGLFYRMVPGREALDHFQDVVENGLRWDVALIREKVVSAANSLGLKVSGLRLASGDKQLRRDLIRLASANPGLRSALLPLLSR
jgi:hypothetical protein